MDANGSGTPGADNSPPNPNPKSANRGPGGRFAKVGNGDTQATAIGSSDRVDGAESGATPGPEPASERPAGRSTKRRTYTKSAKWHANQRARTGRSGDDGERPALDIESGAKPKKSLRESAAAIARYHAMAAAFLGCPELRLSTEPQDEALLLAEAFEEIGKHYQVSVPPKAKAIIELMAVATVVYQPKLAEIAARKRASGPPRAPVAQGKPAGAGARFWGREKPPEPPRPASVQVDPATGVIVPLTGVPDAGVVDLTERELNVRLEAVPPNPWQ